MKKIIGLLFKLSNIRVLSISSIAFIFFMISVLPMVSDYTYEKTGATDSPDISLYYTSDDLFSMAEAYGQDGRDAYILLRYTFDIVWPIVYFMFMVSFIGVLLKRLSFSEKYKYLILLPLVGVIFDFLENIFSVIVMYKYPIEASLFANVAPLMTLSKWLTLGISFITMLYLTIVYIVKSKKNDD